MTTAIPSPPRPRPSAQAARAHPIAWAAYVARKYEPARHIRFMGGLLKEVEEAPGGMRVAISAPPRHGKSWTCSRFFAGWYLGRHPDHKVILVSMQERFSRRWGRAARDDFVQFAPELFGVTTHPRASTAEWEIYRDGIRTEGSMSSIGAGGTITGKGADLIIVEDLIKSDKEAQNPNILQDHWEWFCSAIETRLEPPGRIVVTMTRWSHMDLIGRLMKAQADGELGDPWKFVNLPALAEEDDPMGRKPGEALWPERISASYLNRKRKNVAQSVWSRLFQGQPTPASGDTFKRAWFKYYDAEEKDETGIVTSVKIDKTTPIKVENMYRFATVDLAASMRKRSDYTVMGIWGFSRAPHALFLLDMVRARLSGQEILALLGSRVKAHDLAIVYVEREGKWLEEKLGSVIKLAMRDGVPVQEITPVKDKRERAMSVQRVFQNGQILFPKTKWLPALEDELLSFPDGEHDDMVDVCVYAAAKFQDLVAASLRGPQRYESDDEEGPKWQIGRGR